MEHADILKNAVYKNQKVTFLKGDVKFKHSGFIMKCDSAYLNSKTDMFDAFGHVHIYDPENSSNLYGDSLFYDGGTKKAEMRGNVLLRDEKMTLTTQHMDFLIDEDLAYYYGGGTIIDSENKLQSELGFFNTKTKVYAFKNDVKLYRKAYELTADTLIYNSITEVAYFHGPTTITHPERYLYAEDGEYHTNKGKSYFRKNAVLKNKEYIIRGDSLYYNEKDDYGYGQANVQITAIKDTITIYGDECYHWGKIKKSKVFGDALMTKVVKKDTFFLRSDTLLYHKDTINLKENIWAYKGVRFSRGNTQGICDSLNYDLKDSLLHFVGNPILWNGKSQITSDSLKLQLRQGKPHKMYALVNAYLISQDTIFNFNQVRGRDMTAFFKDGNLDYVLVDGNGRSIYFALKEHKEIAGMNKTLCSNMIINFENNELSDISFLTEPDAQFIPPQNIMEPDKKFKGFSWHIDKRPTKSTMNIK